MTLREAIQVFKEHQRNTFCASIMITLTLVPVVPVWMVVAVVTVDRRAVVRVPGVRTIPAVARTISMAPVIGGYHSTPRRYQHSQEECQD